jgi:hypothetical protein
MHMQANSRTPTMPMGPIILVSHLGLCLFGPKFLNSVGPIFSAMKMDQKRLIRQQTKEPHAPTTPALPVLEVSNQEVPDLNFKSRLAIKKTLDGSIRLELQIMIGS